MFILLLNLRNFASVPLSDLASSFIVTWIGAMFAVLLILYLIEVLSANHSIERTCGGMGLFLGIPIYGLIITSLLFVGWYGISLFQ